MPTEILPDEDETYRIYKLTQQFLMENGYKQYEISNFSHKGYECKHNIGYWTGENYLGLGLGAASLIENVRYSNTSDLYEYLEETTKIHQQEQTHIFATNIHVKAEPLSKKAQMEEYMFLGLRMKQGVTREGFLKKFGMSIDGIYKGVMDNLKAEGLLEMTEGRIRLTDKGMDLGNYVMSQFLLE